MLQMPSGLGETVLQTADKVTGRRPTMSEFVRNMQRFLATDDGPTAVEYSVMLAMILLVCIAVILSIGVTTNAMFNDSATLMP
jgi:pilus assembly protein Flp/PilA